MKAFRYQSTRNKSAFTLIEVVLAMAIAVTALLLVSAGIQASGTARLEGKLDGNSSFLVKGLVDQVSSQWQNPSRTSPISLAMVFPETEGVEFVERLYADAEMNFFNVTEENSPPPVYAIDLLAEKYSEGVATLEITIATPALADAHNQSVRRFTRLVRK